MNTFASKLRLIMISALALSISACTWTQYGGLKQRTFLTETHIDAPPDATPPNAQPAGPAISTTSGAATAALERGARELPESFKREAVNQAITEK